MTVTVRLFAQLKEQVPAGRRPLALEVAEGDTVLDIADRLGIGERALEIMVTRRPQATKSGIRVGSTSKALKKAYPRAKCRPAVVGKDTVECRLSSRSKRRVTETVFTTKRDRVASIVVRFA